MSESLKLFSVCSIFPSRNNPTSGLFVKRRLDAIAGQGVPVFGLKPDPYFPFLRPKRLDFAPEDAAFPMDVKSMFYLPKIGNQLNGKWMSRCVEAWLNKMPAGMLEGGVLDAHFGYPEGVACWLAARRLNLPYFVTIRGLEVDVFARKSSIRGMMIEALCNASGVVAVSDSLKSVAVSNGIPPNKIQVIENGVDGSFFSPGDRSICRQRLSIPAAAKLIVSVASIRQLKGFDLLIEAIASYKNDPDFQCVLIGKIYEADHYKLLAKRIKQLNLEHKVKFVGQASADEVVTWLRASDLFVLPTRREGCCNAVIEALSTGVPVVTTPAGDNTKFVRDGVNGFIVPHESPEEIRNAIDRVFQMSWDPAGISESVRNYTWQGVAEKVIEYFEAGARNRGAGRSREEING